MSGKKTQVRNKAQNQAKLASSLFAPSEDSLHVIEVEDAYDFAERMAKKGNTKVAEIVTKLIEGKGVVHLRDSFSEKVHTVDITVPFTFKQLMSGDDYSDLLGKALRTPVIYDGENHRGFICEVIATHYGHNSQTDVDLCLDVINKIVVATALVSSSSPAELNANLLQKCRENKANQLRVSYVASSTPTEVKPVPDTTSSSAASSSSSSSLSLVTTENEMRREIARETAENKFFALSAPEVMQYESPHILKLYDAFGGLDKASILKGVIVVGVRDDYRYVLETSALAPVIKNAPNTRFVSKTNKFDAGSIHVFRVHKDLLNELVDRVCKNAKEVDSLARRIEDIQCTLRPHTHWTRQKDGSYYSKKHDVTVSPNQRFELNVRMEIKARYYNQPNCFASDPLNVGIWFAPVYKQSDVVYETGSLIGKPVPLHDPSSKAAAEIAKQLSSEHQQQSSEIVDDADDDNQGAAYASSSSS